MSARNTLHQATAAAEANSGSRRTYIGFDQVYSSAADEPNDFELTKEEATEFESTLSSRSTKDSETIRKSYLTADGEQYDEFEFTSGGTEEEKEDEKSFNKSSTVKKPVPSSSTRIVRPVRNSNMGTFQPASRYEPPFDEENVRQLLTEYFKIHEPKAIKDGRLEKLVQWTKERGLGKLRTALKETYGTGLLHDPKAPEKMGSSQRLSLRRKLKSLSSFFGL
jgi:hypothetical protein